MKKITRRLYTKPVMLGMAFLMGMALVVALFVTAKSTAAPNSFPIPAGNDEFETPGDGETYHDFTSSRIPANFFGQGSQEFAQLVPLQGVPLSPASDVDTIIQRHSAVMAPDGSTQITMTALSLKSINPITVTYSGGGSEAWNVRVGLSDFKVSGGTMTIHASSFDSTLKVWPKFTFTRVSDGKERVLDTGDPNVTGFTAAATTAPVDKIGVLEPMPVEPAPAPVPGPTIAPAPCRAEITPFEKTTRLKTGEEVAFAAAASSCAPVTLSSVNSPWVTCANGGFCIPVPITEEERWARHRPGPRGTIKGGAVAE